MENLIEKLKQDIITELNLEDLEVTSFETDALLFGEGVGLDSIDALELIVLLDKKYGVKVKSAEEGKEIFQTVRTLANFIEKNK